MRTRFLIAGVAVAAFALGAAGTFPAQAGGGAQRDSASHSSLLKQRSHLTEMALAAGIQVAPKHETRPTIRVHGLALKAPNPYLAEVKNPAQIDWYYWNKVAHHRSAKRNPVAKVPTPFVYDEQEPPGQFGFNDLQANAEQIGHFGRAPGKQPAVRINGRLSPPDIATDDINTSEDQGSIPLATNTRIPALRDGVFVSSRIGDGPFGSGSSTPSGDFDFFKVGATAGEVIRATTAGSDFDTILLVYDASGNLVAANDDSNGTLQSDVLFQVTTSGNYYVAVTGFLCLPDDPFDSSSGTGAAAEGLYDLQITVGEIDLDYYAVHLNAGDTLGGWITGGATNIQINKPGGADRVGSEFADASFIYPLASPLPGAGAQGNASFAYVAEQAGWYAVSTSHGDGAYHLTLEVYRPGSMRPGTQTVFVDFNGARINTGMWGGFGVVTLSPLSSFLERWGLTNGDRSPLITRVMATVEENLHSDLVARGLNPNVKVNLLNSRDDDDVTGRPNVMHLVVGGTIDQSGVPTIGIAQSIDPGNYERHELGLVLLDIVSDGDPNDDASFNFYITPQSNKLKFIGTALGNIVSHEIGHMLGSFHVDQFNDRLNLMDQGGNFPLLYGVGPDGIGGTADDPDVDFGVDTYNPNEGFTGLENTLNNSAWGL